MLKSQVLSYYKEYCAEFERVYASIKDYFEGDYVSEICQLRGYGDGEQRTKIEQMELGRCRILDTDILGSRRSELGLVTEKDSFLLGDRYIIPVRDIDHNLVALVGWYPDFKKYITTPSTFFSKEALFFNIDEAYDRSWREFGGSVIVVEGMFDTISLSSIGLPVIGTMGSSVTGVKKEQLKLFKKVVGLPDADKVGTNSLNRYGKKGWQVPRNATMIKLRGSLSINSEEYKVKDGDNLVSWFDAESVRDMFLEVFDSKEDLVEFKF